MKTCKQLPLCNVLSIQMNRRELLKSRYRFWMRTYITKAVNISIDRTMWMSDICILNDWSVKYKDIFITITSRTGTQRTLHSLQPWLLLFLAQYFYQHHRRVVVVLVVVVFKWNSLVSSPSRHSICVVTSIANFSALQM